jgi:hypothetical protein
MLQQRSDARQTILDATSPSTPRAHIGHDLPVANGSFGACYPQRSQSSDDGASLQHVHGWAVWRDDDLHSLEASLLVAADGPSVGHCRIDLNLGDGRIVEETRCQSTHESCAETFAQEVRVSDGLVDPVDTWICLVFPPAIA